MNLPAPREVVLVTGISGSGKSIALHALEDAGFFCVDNLPPELLPEFLRLESERSIRRVAVAVDVRTAGSLPRLVPLLCAGGVLASDPPVDCPGLEPLPLPDGIAAGRYHLYRRISR